MKKKALFSSILSIVLCLTMISGATFALFTDSETVNIAVSAGTVDIDVTVENIMTKSYEEADFVANTDFTNGGSVTFVDNTNQLTIDKVTPGDAVKFDLVVTNKSNVDIQFFTKLGLVEGVELFKGMEYTITDKKSETVITAENFDGITRISNWVELDGITDGSTEEIARIEVIIEMPYLTAEEEKAQGVKQNDLMGLSTTLYYTVQAVQGNADAADKEAIVNGATHIYTATDLQIFAANVNNGNTYKGETVVLMNDIDLENMAWTPIGDSSTNPFKGHFDGKDYTVSNLNVDVEEYAGLFGCCWQDGVIIENLNVKNATLKSNHFAGVITAYMYGSILNCSVEGATISVTPNWNESKGSYDNGDKAGALVGWFSGYKPETGVVSGNVVTDVSITAYRDAGGLIGHLADERNDRVPDSVTGNTLTNVTITLNPTHAYTSNASTNVGEVVGRFARPANHVGLNSDTTLNTMTNVTTNKIEIDMTVTNDAELAAALNKIKTDSQYWNTTQPVVVKLVANTYTGNYNFYQYPEWNGQEAAASNIHSLTNATNYTNVIFLGEDGVSFTGNFVVSGNGYSGDAMINPRNAKTTFKYITFDASNSADESTAGDAVAMYVKSAASNVTFEKCVFQNASHVTVGDGGTGAAGTITFDTCDFPDGASLSGAFYKLNVTNCTVATEAETFEDAFVNCNRGAAVVTVDNCTVNCAKYAFRTMKSADSAQTIIVTNSTINVHEYEGQNYLVYFRGGNTETATFTNCSLAYGTQKTGNGTVTIADDCITTKSVAVTSAEELATVLSGAGQAGAGNTMIDFPANATLDMSAVNWTPIKVDGYHGADIVTVNGNGATLKGLNAPLFAGGFAGGSGIVIKNLTIADSNIVSTNTVGSGAFIESVDSMDVITLDNCHLINSTVSGSRTGGLIGWTAGYSTVNDGPVKTYVTVTNCSVIGCTITGSSVGAINGHAGNNDWTYTTIDNCIVKDCNLVSYDDGGWRVGVVVGTANVGEVTISNITESGNTLTQTGKTAPAGQSNLYGRFVPVTTGKLTIDGVEIK